MRRRVFVSGPLTQGNRLANIERAMDATRQLVAAGLAPLTPHTSHFADETDALGYEAWLAVCLAWVAVSDAVLRLPGASAGADRETTFARQCGIPCFDTITALVLHFGRKAD